MGWAKIAWTYGMRILKTLGKPEENINVSALGSDFYKNEIEWVISRAGDTDTNACIVGGLLGSVIGFTKLPAEYLKKIFTLRFP
jgi:ADP-ribosylglycohydrolase